MSLRILVVTNMGRYSVRQQVNGIYRRIDEGLPWDVRLVSSQEEHSTKAIGNALKWRPDGVIVSNNERSVLSPLLGYKAPVVVIDPWKSTLAMGGTRLLSVSCDNEGIGRAAADYFLSLGNFRSFAFIPDTRGRKWSALRGNALARGDAFAERLNENGIVCSRYEPTELVAERTGIVSWLRRLPKPAAVFAANDERATEMIDLCNQARLAVPTRVAVLGADNDEMACRHKSPQLSSVAIDFERLGHLAADLLSRALSGTVPERHLVSNNVGSVIVRGSTRPLSPAEALVERALDFIRRRATSGISANDVARHLHVSKPLMNLRFREAGRGTVLDAITAVRIETAKRLLTTTDDKISVITAAVGFGSENHFKAIFRRETGLTMSAFRSQSPSSTSCDGTRGKVPEG